MKIDRKTLRRAYAADARLASKAADPAAPADPGELTGYLAVYGNADHMAEIILKGAFARSISQKLSKGKTLPLMCKHFAHGGDVNECIGSIVEAKEDDYGLWIRAVYASDAQSQAVRAKVAEKHVKNLSVGFYPVRWQCRPPEGDAETAATGPAGRDDILEWQECELVEGTVTCKPVNELAEILTSKAHADECPHCKQKLDAPPRTASPTPAAPDSTAKSAPAVTAPVAKSAPASTAKHRSAARRRELELLGVL